MNVFSAIGRVGKDAQTRYTGNGNAVTGWSLAVDNGFGDKKQTVWFDCSAWGERFTKVAEYIKKGDRLGVTGEVGTREHDGKTYVTLNVRDVALLAAKKEGAPSRSNAPAPSGDDPNDEIPF